MRNWSPEPFAPVAAPAQPAPGRAPEGERLFRPEAAPAGPGGLLALLTADERAELRQAVAHELSDEQAELRRREMAARDEAAARRLAALAADLEARLHEALAVLTREAVEIAVAMAGQIVRREVAVDHGALERALQTVLYKAEAGARLSVTASPEDAAWLEGNPDLLRRLRIAEVKADRRLEPGGCLVRADGGEWDATVRGQLEVLAELTRQALAAAPAPEPAPPAPAGPRPEETP